MKKEIPTEAGREKLLEEINLVFKSLDCYQLQETLNYATTVYLKRFGQSEEDKMLSSLIEEHETISIIRKLRKPGAKKFVSAIVDMPDEKLHDIFIRCFEMVKNQKTPD